MGAVSKTGWVEGHHAGFNIIAAEKIASVVKQHFIIIIIVVIKRHFQRAGITFNRTRDKSTHHKALADKGGMCRRRKMVAMRHQRANITPVEAHDREIAMPTHRIQRIKREGDGA